MYKLLIYSWSDGRDQTYCKVFTFNTFKAAVIAQKFFKRGDLRTEIIEDK